MEDETRRWLDKAEEDLENAQVLLDAERWGGASFYAQQTAEKALKALLIETEGKFPKTHDLVKLARACDAPEEIEAACADLSPAYMSQRYPDVENPVDEEDATRFLEEAQEVLDWVRDQIS